MHRHDLNDTIAAIGTGVGESGIGIVRLSGQDALAIADKIFMAKDGKKPSSFKTYTVHYGWVKDKDFIDEVILTVMRAPKSYTKEDVVEISCHGGIVAMRGVLDLVLKNGCRLADPGEFTKRAFLNGRIDLAQAEAVLDIIRSKTDSALKLGLEQLKGGLSFRINKIRDNLLGALAQLEANIDFPDEEIGAVNLERIRNGIGKADNELKNILENAKYGRILREGLHAVICGKPNVGKSSLLNALLKEERSIVTPVAGTTRDTIEEIIDIRGIPVRIVDTAGIIQPRGLVEKKAIQRSRKYMALADLVILMFDGSKSLSSEDKSLMNKLKKKQVIAVINKIDLKQKIQKDKIAGIFKYVVGLSAKKLKNINLLEDAVVDLVSSGKAVVNEAMAVSNRRHIEAIRQAQKLIAEALNSADNKVSAEFIAQGIKDALFYLDDILGKRFSESLLDKIFNEFCIGK